MKAGSSERWLATRAAAGAQSSPKRTTEVNMMTSGFFCWSLLAKSNTRYDGWNVIDCYWHPSIGCNYVGYLSGMMRRGVPGCRVGLEQWMSGYWLLRVNF